MKRILLTGAAGTIGTSLRNSLGNRYQFRCLDTSPIDDEDDVVNASILDFESVLTSMNGVDAVIHLAANPNPDQLWEEVNSHGIGGTYNVFEAARRAKVKTVIYASSLLVHGRNGVIQKKRVFPDTPFEPKTLYGIGKATGELLARFFAENFEMSIICIRIGYFYVDLPSPQSPQDDILKAWVSPEDLAQLVDRCLDTDNLGFQVFYGVSNNKPKIFDIQNARKLVGYRPKSNAKDLFKPSGEFNAREVLLKDHALLIRAAVQEGPDALKNWQSWLQMTEMENANLDPITYRLLPLVYYNLADQEYSHPSLTKLKGIYRRAWLENQLTLQKVIPYISQIHDEGIPILVMDDLTSILRLYDGQGVRRLNSLDMLVHQNDIPRLLGLLSRQNIWPKISFGERYLIVETPLEIWSPFDIPFTIAWRVFPHVKTREQADAIWQSTNTTLLGECPVSTLDLENHFLRLCLRTVGSRPDAAFFSLIDVVWMIRKHADSMNWEKVVELAQSYHQVLPVVKCLQEISANLGIPKTDELLERFLKLPISWLDHLENHFVYKYRPFPGLITRFSRRFLQYLRSPKVPGLIGFFRYFQYAWGGNKLHSLVRLTFHHFRNL